MKTITHRIDIADGLHIFKQTNSKRWYARFKIEGEWYSRATKEKEEKAATVKAIQLHTEYKILISNNLPVHTVRKSKKNTFKAVTELAIQRMESAIANNTGKTIFADYIQVLNKYFVPFFGSMQIRETIERQVLLEFDGWRNEKLGRVPAKSTILTHNAAMSRVLDEAVIQKLITASEVPVLQNTGLAGVRRAAFTKEEYNQIVKASKNWINEGRTAITRDIRQSLHFYIQIAALTGMRAGTEMDNLTWDDLQVREIDEKVHILITVRKGKTTKYTGTREIVCRQEVLHMIEEVIVTLGKGKRKGTDLIFKNAKEFGKNFTKLLIKLNLKTNAIGERTLYSLRHSYITWALEGGRPIVAIAVQCGTSAEMIERHYSHIVPVMFAKELSGRK